MRRAVALTQLVGWMAALAGGLKVLAWTDAGALRGPSLRHWSLALAWLTSHDTVITAFVAVRLLATAACGYLLAVTIVGVVAHLLDLRQVAAWASRANAEVAGKIRAAALGAGMMVTSVAVPATAEGRGSGQPPSSPASPTMHRLGPTPTAAPPTTTVAPSTTT